MRVLVSGSSGVLGQLVGKRLGEEGVEPVPTARSPRAGSEDMRLDLNDLSAVQAAAKHIDAAILCPILTVSAPAARELAEAGVRRLVVFSSNNVGIDRENPVYEGLAQAEASLAGIPAEVVILRPTMIYGYETDGNLSKLMRFAGRFGFLPCPGDGQALQQPVFVGDAANAAVCAVLGGFSEGPFSVAGPEIVTTGDLFSSVLAARGRNPRAVIKIPLAPLRLAAATAERLGVKAPLGTAQLARISKDKTASEPLPLGFVPTTSLGEGLGSLARALAATPGRG